MASRGIKDRVAIVGMGCTRFGEHWGKGADDLLIDAAYECYESAGVDPKDVEAYWLGTMGSGVSGLALSGPLKIDYKPVTRVENMCATGSEALRQACYAVAAGAYDLVMAIGVEKLKDSGYSGLVVNNAPNDGTLGNITAPASFSLLAPAYFKKYGLDAE
ncbi:MAG: acetyl-CoA acetyltransferase, partial [Candidatus Binataceae bacterium]